MPISLPEVKSGYNLGLINDNFQTIQDAWDEKLDRIASTQPNQLEQNIDMNSNRIINHPNARIGDVTGNQDIVLVEDITKLGDYSGVVPTVDSYLGDGSRTTFPFSSAVTDPKAVQLYIGGLRQEPYTDYVLNGSNLELTTAPVLDVEVDIYAYNPTILENGAPVYAEPKHGTFTGDGSQVQFIVSAIGASTLEAMCYIDGVKQNPFDDYVSQNGVTTFTEAPPLNSQIDITIWAPFSINADNSVVTADGSTTGRDLSERFADVVNVKDFGAVGDGVTDDTVAFQAALDSTKNLSWNLPAFLGFSFKSTVYVPSGIYRVGDLELPVGTKIVGAGSSSSVLRATETATSIIRAGHNLVPPERGAVDDRMQGGVYSLSIIGLPDPAYDPLTLQGRRNKQHITQYGLHLDGTFQHFRVEDVMLMFCQENIHAEQCYTLSMDKVISRDSTTTSCRMVGPSNGVELSNCSWHYSTVGFILEGDTGGAKPLAFRTNMFEHNLREGLQVIDTPIVNIDTCYFENNSLLNSDGTFITGQDVLIDTVTGGALRGDVHIQDTLFNSITSTATGVDQLYVKDASRLTLENCSFGASDGGQQSSIRIGDVGTIYTQNNNIFTSGNQKPILYDTGFNTYVATAKDLPNGNLNVWQQGTTATEGSSQQINAADKIYVQNGSISQGTFTPSQKNVPGYPEYFGSFVSSAIDGNIGYKIDRREVGNSGAIFGVWLKSTDSSNVQLRITETGSGTTNKSFALDNVWRFYSIDRDVNDIQREGNTLEFYIRCEESGGSFDFANITFDEDFLKPANTSFIMDSELFSEIVVREAHSERYTNDTSFKYIRIDYPVPMKNSTTFPDISGLVLNNCSATVSDADRYGMTVRMVPTVAGDYGFSGKYIVKTLI